MGYWGSVVVGRSEVDLCDLAALRSRDDGYDELDDLLPPWQIGRWPGSDLALYPDAMLAELVQETGGPALAGYLMDSDDLDLAAHSSASGSWRALLPVRRDGGELLSELPTADRVAGEQALAAALRWAKEAGLRADAQRLRELFTVPDDHQFGGERALGRLLSALGLTERRSK